MAELDTELVELLDSSKLVTPPSLTEYLLETQGCHAPDPRR
jgi:hypothetical protein